MGRPIRVLIIEDSENDSQFVLREIQRGGYDVEWERVERRSAMESALVRRQWDVIICDHSLPEFNAIAALETLHTRGLDLPLIIVSDSRGEIVYVSPAVKTILYYEPSELLGDNWWKVSRSGPMQAQREKEYLAQAARGEIPVAAEAYERAIQDRSGNTHWI